MLNLSPEIAALNPPDAAALIARERREIFSIHPELRAMAWGGAILIAAGVAVLLSEHYERIGPAILATLVAVAAAAAYGYALWRRRSGVTGLVDEYVLLLAALLLSGDLAFIEGQFHLLDHGWPRHLLILAIVHGLTAYYFDSRTLLSLSIVALAGWMGIEQQVGTLFDSSTETAVRAFLCSAVVLMWRLADMKWRASRSFARVFDHFIANLALAGGLILLFDDATRPIGALITIVLAVITARYAFHVRSESFILYAYAYAFLAVVVTIVDLLNEETTVTLFIVLASITAIAGLFVVHAAFKRRTA